MRNTIFVVEDDADIARLVQHHLEGAGYAVRWFSTAVQVIAQAEKSPPSLFLLDVMVPGGDGFDLCRRIRKSPALAQVPVIFLTAKTAETDRVAGFELGADDYVTKPYMAELSSGCAVSMCGTTRAKSRISTASLRLAST